MVGAIIVSANLANIVLLPRIGPKLLVAPGMLAAAAGLAWLTRIVSTPATPQTSCRRCCSHPPASAS